MKHGGYEVAKEKLSWFPYTSPLGLGTDVHAGPWQAQGLLRLSPCLTHMLEESILTNIS